MLRRDRAHQRVREDRFALRRINVTFTSVGDIDAWKWKRVGLRMDDASGKFALVMLRAKQVRVHHKRTKHEYVFRISEIGSKLQMPPASKSCSARRSKRFS